MNDSISRTASCGEAFYVSHHGHKFGPYSIAELQNMARAGQLKPHTEVHRTTDGQLFPAHDIPWLFSDKDWTVALLLSVFLGVFGVDRIYLGHVLARPGQVLHNRWPRPLGLGRHRPHRPEDGPRLRRTAPAMTKMTHRTSGALKHGRSAATAGLLCLAIAAGTLLTACYTGAIADHGPTRTEQRPVDGVHAVDLRTSGDLTISTGATPKLTITAGRPTLRYLTSTLQGGTVVLGSCSGHNVSGDIHYQLTLPTLDGLVIAGSGSAHGTVVADGSFTVTVSGSGSATLKGLAATTVAVQLSGSGDIRLTGATDAQSVEIEGSGTYLGSELTSQTSDVEIGGSGDAHVDAINQLVAQISGSGSISYTGSPVLTTHISGNGTINGG